MRFMKLKKTIRTIAVITAVLLLFAGWVNALTWHKANTSVVLWDAPTTMSESVPIPSDWTLKYYIYTKDKDGGNVTALGETTETEFAVILAATDKKYVGVSVVGIDPDGLSTDESPIAWSDDPASCKDGQDFGVYYLGVINFGQSNLRTK